ncbi:MAG: GNAT family N-acetyltransferase [Oligoflexia bacterium]|nr:GNAT family N-acetyltransferase [Oligoflexia bacterium]
MIATLKSNASRIMNPKTMARLGRMKARAPFKALKERFTNFPKKNNFPLRGFQRKIDVFQSTEKFILKTAQSPFELKQALRLRHDIFYKELQGRELPSKIDIDELDEICDHIVIIDKANSRVVGTYRVISSLYSDRFYSAGEFYLENIAALEGNKLELGRACIHPDYRNGAIISLLWKGIFEYVKKTQTEYLFGCASVQTTNPYAAASILEKLKEKNLYSEQFGVRPTAKYFSFIPKNIDTSQAIEGSELPALVQSYILAGAQFHGEPALDSDFSCYDFFMMLKISEMSKIFRRKYMTKE